MMTHNNYSVYEYQIQYQNFGNEWGLFVDLENSYLNTNNNIIISNHDTNNTNNTNNNNNNNNNS
jgi:hypothetical protein